MKYTVVIRQAVPADQRQSLEQQLMERFNLSGDQAQRLSARKSGRLMKPTNRSRAELLMGVFQDFGASVALEEVRDETGLLSEPFQGVSSRAAPGSSSPPVKPRREDDAVLAPLMPPEASTVDVFRTGIIPPTPWPDPVSTRTTQVLPPSMLDWPGYQAAVNAPAAALDPLTSASLAGARAGRPAEPSPAPAAHPDVAAVSSTATRPEPAESLPKSPAFDVPVTEEPPALSATPDTADVWADFTGSLAMPEAAQPEQPSAKSTSISPILMPPPAEDTPPAPVKRGSLARQVSLATLLPLALSSALTLGVLALTLPGLQARTAQSSANLLMTVLGNSVDTTNAERTVAQLDAISRDPGVGFVRVELPNGNSYLRSPDKAANQPIFDALVPFLKTNPSGGKATLHGVNYLVQRQAFQKNPAGAGVSPTTAGNPNASYTVTVGVPQLTSSAALRNTLLLVLGVALLGLLLAALLAARAARQIIEPVQRLVKVADAISMGDLTRPVQAERQDELGDLAQALERMRLSLEAAMERLRRRKRT